MQRGASQGNKRCTEGRRERDERSTEGTEGAPKELEGLEVAHARHDAAERHGAHSDEALEDYGVDRQPCDLRLHLCQHPAAVEEIEQHRLDRVARLLVRRS